MRICFNKLSGLALLRRARITEAISHARVCGLPEPDPHPQKRWSPRLIPLDALSLSAPPSASAPVYVAAPSKQSRPQARFISSTVYSSGLPAGSFLQLGESLYIPCPELLFAELATMMDPAALELLGYELCGTFSRDPSDPRCGLVTHDIEPATSVESIRSYLEGCHRIAGTRAARLALDHVSDNAWSAMEAVVALLLRRPVGNLGYGMGSITLNQRQDNPRQLVRLGCKTTRIPDIVLEEHPIGFNYDGKGHLDLDSVLQSSDAEDDLRATLRDVRERYVDDRQRDRELAANGRVVMPIVAEDLYANRGLDAVVMEALMASERLGGPPMKEAISQEVWDPQVSAARQQLIWSLLPWNGGRSLGAY